MILRSDIVALARSYEGVPWRHQGRTKKGVDCVGLLIAVHRDLGLGDVSLPPYGRLPDGSLLGHFHKHLVPTTRQRAREGTVVVFSYWGSPFHAGIVVNTEGTAIIHAYARERKVVYDMIDHGQMGRRFHSAYDWPEVRDG